LLLDLEASGKRVYRIGAVLGGTELSFREKFDRKTALAAVDGLTDGARVILGHNLLGHDLPILQQVAPDLKLHRKPVLDTLYLSPVAFPENPYHRLVKDYKLVRQALSDPVADARLAARLFADQWQAFADLASAHPELVSFYRSCFEDPTFPLGGGAGFCLFFDALGAPSVSVVQTAEILRTYAEAHCCRTALAELAERVEAADIRRAPLAYCLAWLRVSGHNSVLPPWVGLKFPETVSILRDLRDRPCADPACEYCVTTHEPTRQLSRFFGFDSFRAEPATEDGASLQEEIVRRGMCDEPLLAILPTGAGKSLCYQLPALARNLRRGVLTIVVSPLQALMKDQVDNLHAKTGTNLGGAIYGMLTPPERGTVLDGVRLGDVAVLYVSPEQLRNRSFAEAIKHREIGCWVFDEAHCLSKWGHSFRPDYLYASRFIREFAEKQHVPVPPVACFTATAKQDVMDEIVDHFRRELKQELAVFRASERRENLDFEVQTVTAAEKWERIHTVLAERLPDPADGAAVVYVSTRVHSVRIAEFLQKKGWAAAAFHAGLPAPDKRQVQEDFLADKTQVICATNAFGMGIDKENVRLVIHADIPGSLENYLQEAGRAGRDRHPASCVLLYDQEDIETQFQLGALSQLTQYDVVQILRGLRKVDRQRHGKGGDDIVLTTGEILRDEDVETSFDSGDNSADTKVRAAISLLERTQFLERNQNRTSVFQGRPLVRSLEEAEEKMRRLDLSDKARGQWLAILRELLNATESDGFSADEFAELPEFRSPPEMMTDRDLAEGDTVRIMRTLTSMAQAGLIHRTMLLTAYVRHKVQDSSRERLQKVCALDKAMLDLMQEAAPDDEGWLDLSLPRLNQRLLDQGHTCTPASVLRLLRSLEADGKGLAGSQGSVEVKLAVRGQYRVKRQRSWQAIVELAEKRRRLAEIALDVMGASIPAEAKPSASVLVEFSEDDLIRAFHADLFLRGEIRDDHAAAERALMFLHEQNVVILQSGLAVFRQAMTIRIKPDRRGHRFGKGDYESLAQHYGERVFQVHVINEYARLGVEKLSQALGLVAAYFSLGKEAFVHRYFADRKDVVERATSAESYHRIVDSLGNPLQARIVAAPASRNMLVLAGPGSGKTRVVVHRCGYLLRVERVPARGILVVCFNRHAAIELRRRLRDLVGDDARGVTVQTYHGLAMRLTGTSLAERIESGADAIDFESMLDDAIALLKGDRAVSGFEPDDLRDSLLGGFRHILVDEYQDIDAKQYELISSIAGRTLSDPESKLTIMAVGDDDQNIYSFRGTNVEYIRRFRDDYEAEPFYLTGNYRSTANIIAAANCFIAQNHDRMKTDHPIVIDRDRRSQAPGGRWQSLDSLAQGRVQVLTVSDAAHQAQVLVAELARMRELAPDMAWRDCAVLARTRDELATMRAALEHHGIPVQWAMDRDATPPLHRVREIASWLADLKTLRAETPRADDLLTRWQHAASGQEGNAWWQLVRDMIDEWRDETGNSELPGSAALDFFYDTLVERRREQSFGAGVFLATAHAAKGLEFDHVFIPSGGWTAGHLARMEEERRVFYVAMTRARHSLCIFDRADARNPHTRNLRGDFLLRRRGPAGTPLPPDVLSRQYETLTLRDMYLDFPARYYAAHPIHHQLAQLQPGDILTVCTDGPHVHLRSPQGLPVAALSSAAASRWREHLDTIEQIRVAAMIQRHATDGADQRTTPPRVDRWEVPLVEAVGDAASTMCD